MYRLSSHHIRLMCNIPIGVCVVTQTHCTRFVSSYSLSVVTFWLSNAAINFIFVRYHFVAFIFSSSFSCFSFVVHLVERFCLCSFFIFVSIGFIAAARCFKLDRYFCLICDTSLCMLYAPIFWSLLLLWFFRRRPFICSINSQVIHWQRQREIVLLKLLCTSVPAQQPRCRRRCRWCNLMSRHFNFFFIGFDDKRVDCGEFIEFCFCCFFYSSSDFSSLRMSQSDELTKKKSCTKRYRKWTPFSLFRETVRRIRTTPEHFIDVIKRRQATVLI